MNRHIIAASLVVAFGLGMAGSFAPGPDSQEVFWFLSTAGLITGCALLVARAAMAGHDVLAVGLGLLVVAEAIMSAGGTSTTPGALEAFAHGVGMYVPALLLIASSTGTATWSRWTAVGAAAAFVVHAALFLAGEQPDQDGVAVGIGYFLLSATFVGWIIGLYRPTSAPGLNPAMGATRE